MVCFNATMLAWLRRMFRVPAAGLQIAPPPFLACKRTGVIMNGLWYGNLTPDEARAKARSWGFTDEMIEEMVARATKPPSYWARHAAGEALLPVATVRRGAD